VNIACFFYICSVATEQVCCACRRVAHFFTESTGKKLCKLVNI